MNDYITTKRPSWRMRLLGFLGVTDLPIKVNCWYCNQDSYLLPGSKDKEEDWQCNICENRNIRDEVSLNRAISVLCIALMGILYFNRMAKS